MRVKTLSIYPLKGAAGHSLTEARVLGSGLEHDRRFVLVDEAGEFVSQRSVPTLALLRMRLEPALELDMRGQTLRLTRPTGPERTVKVWDDDAQARDWGDEAAAFLRHAFGQTMRLCEHLPHAPRHVDERYSQGLAVPYYFADGFPILVISQESLDLLNQKLVAVGQAPVPMNRFRPNIVIEGWTPHGEDQAPRIRIGDALELALVKPCGRCTVPTVDQSTGVSGVEPLKTLATYRKGPEGGAVLFGQNAYAVRGQGATIRLGDPVEIIA